MPALQGGGAHGGALQIMLRTVLILRVGLFKNTVLVVSERIIVSINVTLVLLAILERPRLYSGALCCTVQPKSTPRRPAAPPPPLPDPTSRAIRTCPCIFDFRRGNWYVLQYKIPTLRMQLQPGTCPFSVLGFWGTMTMPSASIMAYRRDFPSTTRI